MSETEKRLTESMPGFVTSAGDIFSHAIFKLLCQEIDSLKAQLTGRTASLEIEDLYASED